MTLSTITPTGSSMNATLQTMRRTGYRAVPGWHEVARKGLQVESIATVRDLAAKLPKRVCVMLNAMSRSGASDLADQWLAQFESARCVVPEPWDEVVIPATVADGKQNVALVRFQMLKTPEEKFAYKAALRCEVAAKLRELRALEAL